MLKRVAIYPVTAVPLTLRGLCLTDGEARLQVTQERALFSLICIKRGR